MSRADNREMLSHGSLLGPHRVPDLRRYSMRDPHHDYACFHVPFNGLEYDVGSNYDIAKSIEAGRVKSPTFTHEPVWRTREDKRKYAKYKLNRE